MKIRKFFVLIHYSLLIGLFLVMSSCKEGAIRVQTEKVFRDRIVQTVTGTGKIYPVTEVRISARVPGKIIRIAVEEGDSVKAGQQLVWLEQEQYEAELERAKSALLEAEANLTLARQEFQRTEQLYQQNLTSQAELEAARARYDQALSRVKQAKANVKEAQTSLERTVLSSPIDGVVIQKNKEEGEIALGSQFQEDVILVVAQLSEMEVRVEVNENDIVEVVPGDTAFVEIDAFPDTTFRGIVTDIAHSAITKGQGTIEEVTNYEVRVRLVDKLPTFRPGMSATADIATEVRENALNLPIQSVTVRERETLKMKEDLESPGSHKSDTAAATISSPKKKKGVEDDLVEVVFVVKNGRVKMQPVKLGISDDSYYEVLSGVEEGDEVVTGPYKILSQTLKDGDKVRVFNPRRKKRTTEEDE
ncbi:MAG: efflux RND transporter periplasmic adaptor subunit [Calditrichaeota bacterium]|nr:MAG: efflux RND transporter periplasmic adaptor subunit [Calditrichota bacterium]